MSDSQKGAGGSARREYERRKALDQQRIRDRWGPLGEFAVALTPERQCTRAWAKGAEGEQRLGAKLDSLASDHVAVLHDRRIPRSSANLDHIAITSTGTYVIDAKHYKGRPERRTQGGLFTPRVEKLFVNRLDCSRLIEGVQAQVELVQSAVGRVPVRGVVCFIDADWALFDTCFTVAGVLVMSPRQLRKRLSKQVSGTVDVHRMQQQLAECFPPA